MFVDILLKLILFFVTGYFFLYYGNFTPNKTGIENTHTI